MSNQIIFTNPGEAKKQPKVQLVRARSEIKYNKKVKNLGEDIPTAQVLLDKDSSMHSGSYQQPFLSLKGAKMATLGSERLQSSVIYTKTPQFNENNFRQSARSGISIQLQSGFGFPKSASSKAFLKSSQHDFLQATMNNEMVMNTQLQKNIMKTITTKSSANMMAKTTTNFMRRQFQNQKRKSYDQQYIQQAPWTSKEEATEVDSRRAEHQLPYQKAPNPEITYKLMTARGDGVPLTTRVSLPKLGDEEINRRSSVSGEQQIVKTARIPITIYEADSSQPASFYMAEYERDVKHCVLDSIKQKYNFFEKKSLNLFKYGYESEMFDELLQALGPITYLKSILRDEIVYYTKSEIEKIQKYKSSKFLDQIRDSTELALEKNRDMVEDKILFRLLKYKEKYEKVRTECLKGKISHKTGRVELDKESVVAIKKKIGENYFKILYTARGFVTDFMPEYWNAQKMLINYIKQGKENVEHSSLLVIETLSFLKYMMAIRIDALFQHEEYLRTSTAEAFKTHIMDQLGRMRKENYEQMKIKSGEFSRVRDENEELFDQVRKITKERDTVIDELDFQNQRVTSLEEQVKYGKETSEDYISTIKIMEGHIESLEKGIKTTMPKIGSNFAIHGRHEQTGKAEISDLSFIDHQLMTHFKDDSVFGMISKLTNKLEKSMEDIKTNRVSSLQLQQSLETIVTQGIENSEGYSIIKEYKDQIETLQVKNDDLRQNVEMLNKQREIEGKSQTFVINHQYHNDTKINLGFNKGTQTDIGKEQWKLLGEEHDRQLLEKEVQKNELGQTNDLYNNKFFKIRDIDKRRAEIKTKEDTSPQKNLKTMVQKAFLEHTNAKKLALSKRNMLIIDNSKDLMKSPSKSQDDREIIKSFTGRNGPLKNTAEKQTGVGNSQVVRMSLSNSKNILAEVSTKREVEVTKFNQNHPSRGSFSKQSLPRSRSVESIESNSQTNQTKSYHRHSSFENSKTQIMTKKTTNQDKSRQPGMVEEFTFERSNETVKNLNPVIQNGILQLNPKVTDSSALALMSNNQGKHVMNIKIQKLMTMKPDNDINVAMTQKNMFKIIDTLILSRLENVFEDQSAFRGYISKQMVKRLENLEFFKGVKLLSWQEISNGQGQSQFQQKSLLEFSLNQFVMQQNLKSRAINKLRSIAKGLFKAYSLDKDSNFYAKYLIKVFDFDIEGIDQDDDQGATPIFRKNKEIEFNFDNRNKQLDGYNPFGKPGEEQSQKLTEEQVSVILWSRKVFLESQSRYKKLSRKLPGNQLVKFGKNIVDYQLDKFNELHQVQNGGLINLNFLFLVLNNAIFGKFWNSKGAASSALQSLNQSLETSLYEREENESAGKSSQGMKKQAKEQREQEEMFLASVNYNQAKKQLLGIIINLQSTEVMISANASGQVEGEFQVYKQIYDFDPKKQIVIESQFLLWKCLLLIRNSDCELDKFTVHGNEGMMLSEVHDTVDFKISSKSCVDVLSILNLISYKYKSSDLVSPVKEHRSSVAIKQASEGFIFSQSELDKIQVMLTKIMGYNVDLRKVPTELLTAQIEQSIDNPYLYNHQKNDQGLFTISFLQFSQIMLNQWRKNIDQQIKVLQKIFVENDTNHDGVLDLTEFNILMRTMHERELKLDQLNQQQLGLGICADCKSASFNDRQNNFKQRIVQLFNEALDTSIGMYARKQRIEVNEAGMGLNIERKDDSQLSTRLKMKRTDVNNDNIQKLKVPPPSDEESNQIDKLDPLAFTQTMMQNRVGGFGLGQLLSDLRFSFFDY